MNGRDLLRDLTALSLKTFYEGMHVALAIGKPDLLRDSTLRAVYREVLRLDAPALPVVHAFYSTARYVHECQIPGVLLHGAAGSRVGVTTQLGTLTKIGSDRRVMIYGLPSSARSVPMPEPPLGGAAPGGPDTLSGAPRLSYFDPQWPRNGQSRPPETFALISLRGDDVALLRDLDGLFPRLSVHGVVIVGSSTADSTAMRAVAGVADRHRSRIFFHRITATSWIGVKQAVPGTQPGDLGW